VSRRDLLESLLGAVVLVGATLKRPSNYYELRDSGIQNLLTLNAIGNSFCRGTSKITRETHIHSVPADARQAVESVEKLFGTSGNVIGPKRTQVPDWPELGNVLIN
jgi:hypothetical protein